MISRAYIHDVESSPIRISIHVLMRDEYTCTCALKVPSDGSRAIAHLPISLYYRVLSV